MDPADAWAFLPIGYLVTILIETLVLLPLLSRRHSIRRRLFAGVWLTACTYPIVVLVLPMMFDITNDRAAYLWVAEIFAPAAECLVFAFAFGTATWKRDSLAIIAANLASFLLGELIFSSIL